LQPAKIKLNNLNFCNFEYFETTLMSYNFSKRK
jgi:hypothetical protein